MDKKIYVNLESKTIFITDTINDQNMGYVAFNLLHMIKEDDICEEQMKDFEREPIHIHIMSPGGSVTAAWAIVDIIENSKIGLNNAIKLGGTTIRSFTSEEGVHGLPSGHRLSCGGPQARASDGGQPLRVHQEQRHRHL